MRIVVAETAGFCWGVQRAIDIALDVSKTTGEPVYTYGPLIHNKQVVEELQKKNIHTLEKDVSEAGDGSLVIRAHGIRPDLRERIMDEHNNVIDATCPLVTKVHRKIEQHLDQNFTICIMGDANHPEVLGLIGAARDEAIVVPPDPEQVKKMDSFSSRVLLVSQTTQNNALFEEIADILIDKCKELKVINTICEPTRSHQNETMDVSSRVDTVVVVGGRHSANTKHLAELAARYGPRVIHVETDSELKASDFKNTKVVGVTAGASTPQWMIRRVIERLKSFDGRTGFFKTMMASFVEAVVPTNIHTVLAFTAIYIWLIRLSNSYLDPVPFLSSIATVFGLHCINEFGDESGFDRRSRLSPALYQRLRAVMLFLAVVSLIAGVMLSIAGAILGLTHPAITISLIIAAVGGVVYGWKLVPQKYIRRLGFRSIKDLPGSKDLSVSLGWTLMLTSVLLFSAEQITITFFLPVIVFVFLMIFRRSALLAVRDVQGDRIVGMESSFKFLGKKKARRLHRWLDLTLVLLSIVLAIEFLKTHPLTISGALVSSATGLVYSQLYRRRMLPAGSTGQFLMDLQFVAPGAFFMVLSFFF